MTTFEKPTLTLVDLAAERERLAEEQEQLAGRIVLLVRQLMAGRNPAEIAPLVEQLIVLQARLRRLEAEFDWRISAAMAEEKRVRGRA